MVAVGLVLVLVLPVIEGGYLFFFFPFCFQEMSLGRQNYSGLLSSLSFPKLGWFNRVPLTTELGTESHGERKAYTWNVKNLICG